MVTDFPGQRAKADTPTLTEFAVAADDPLKLHDYTAGLGVSLQCFDGNQIVFAFLPHVTIEHFGRRKLTEEQANSLVQANLESIKKIFLKNYAEGRVMQYLSNDGGRSYPLVPIPSWPRERP